MTTQEIIEWTFQGLADRCEELALKPGQDWTDEDRKESNLLDIAQKRVFNLRKMMK